MKRTINFKKVLVLALAVMMMVPSLVMANKNSFALYHLTKNKLSMSDQAFDKSRSEVTFENGVYTFKLYTQGMTKTVGKVYWADCTKLIFKTADGGKIVATPHGSRKPSNESKVFVPEYFTASVPAKDLKHAIVGNWTEYFHVEFDTNLDAAGIGGKIAKAMMKPEARLYVK